MGAGGLSVATGTLFGNGCGMLGRGGATFRLGVAALLLCGACGLIGGWWTAAEGRACCAGAGRGGGAACLGSAGYCARVGTAQIVKTSEREIRRFSTGAPRRALTKEVLRIFLLGNRVRTGYSMQSQLQSLEIFWCFGVGRAFVLASCSGLRPRRLKDNFPLRNVQRIPRGSKFSLTRLTHLFPG